MRRLTLLLAVAVLSSGFAPRPKPAAKPTPDRTDLKALQGTWELVRLSTDGVPCVCLPGAKTLTVAGMRLAFTSGGKTDSGWSMVLDPKNPRWIDLKGRAGDWPGIYRFEGDELQTCTTCDPGGTRPTAFKAAKGLTLKVFKRKKP